jgi:hypothetical protein
MAEKDDRENLGDDLGQRQHLILLELSSEIQDRVPSPGIAFARMIQSNDAAISDMIFSFLLLTVSAPAETGPAIKKLMGRPRLVMYIVPRTTVEYENHIFRNCFFSGPLRIALVWKTLNEACCHGRCSFVIFL